jgi:hypothetical protein
MSEWADAVASHGVAAVALACGLQAKHDRSFAPCPACGAEERGKGDKRGMIGTRRDDRGWACHRCGVKGDPVSLLALVVTGSVSPTDWADVRERAQQLGLYSGGTPVTGAPLSVPRETFQPEPPKRVDPGEVLDLWNRCIPVRDDTRVASWLTSRALDHDRISVGALARALPANGSLPSWARCRGGSWRDQGYLLVVPMNDESGKLAGLRARRVVKADDDLPKGAAMAGAACAGLIMARKGAKGVRQFWVVEGETDFLRVSTLDQFWDKPTSPWVVGVVSGSWTQALGDGIPNRSTIVLATDPDPAGDKYASVIATTLAARERSGLVRVLRRRGLWWPDGRPIQGAGASPAHASTSAGAETSGTPGQPVLADPVEFVE